MRPIRATSPYKQVQVTVTELSNGHCSARVRVKPVDAEWHVKHTVWHHEWRVEGPTPHWLDLLAHFWRTIGQEHL